MDKQLEKIINMLWQLKYRNIIAYDTKGSGISKFLVVATALNTADNKKLSEQFAKDMDYLGKMDGWHRGEWIVLDFDEVIVQLFALGHREKYNIDKLYKGREISVNMTEKKKKGK